MKDNRDMLLDIMADAFFIQSNLLLQEEKLDNIASMTDSNLCAYELQRLKDHFTSLYLQSNDLLTKIRENAETIDLDLLKKEGDVHA